MDTYDGAYATNLSGTSHPWEVGIKVGIHWHYIAPDKHEMEDYFESIYKLQDDARLFEVTKYFLHHEMERGCKKAGVKEIRIHDLRHSHCALLISLGYSPIQIAERMGHESVTITERYSHLYPTVQQEMATKLDVEFAEGEK